MTTSATPALSIAETIFKEVVWNPMIKAGEVWLAGAEAAIPILDLPIFQSLEDAEIEKLTDALFNLICLSVDVETIELLNPARQSAYESSSEALKLIADEKGTESDAYKQALSDAITAQVKLTSFIGN